MRLSDIAVFFSMLCFLSSCRTDIELDSKDSDKTYLVVDGMITSEAKSHCITLSTSSPFFGETTYNPITKAEVTLSDGSDQILLKEKKSGEYYTQEDWSGVPGKTYTLTVKTEQDNVSGVYKAVSTMPEAGAGYGRMDYFYDKDTQSWEFEVWMRDFPDIISYYVIFCELNGKRLQGMLGILNGDSYLDGFYINGGVFFSLGVRWDGYLKEPLKKGDVVTLYVCCAPKDYYDFTYAISVNTQLSLPLLTPPPANCPTNVSSDGLGFFSACYVEPLSVTITDPYKPYTE